MFEYFLFYYMYLFFWVKVDEICVDGAKVCVLKQYTNTVNYDQLKPGGSIPAKGKKISVNIKSLKDLTRDVIKVIFLLRPIPL